MAELIPKQIQERLNALAHAKAKELLDRAKKVLSDPKYVGRGELLSSLNVNVTEATDNTSPAITLTFAEQGRFLQVKKMIWGKVAELGKMEEWVKGKGVDSFRYVSGYAGKNVNLSDEQKIKKIAAGVAWSQRLHQSDWKQKKWKRATLVELLKDLNLQTGEIWREGIAHEIELELTKK
jgi:hypothetical protein